MAPTLDSTEIKLAPSGAVWVAPAGTAAPTDSIVAMGAVNASWINLGYVTEDGVTMNPSVNVKDINAWQSAAPVVTTLNTVGLDFKFTLMQTTQEVLGIYLFGATTTIVGNTAKIVIPSSPSLLSKSLVLEWVDQYGYKNRVYVPTCIVSDHDAVKLQRTEATEYGLTLRAQDTNGVLATMFSNDPHLLSDS